MILNLDEKTQKARCIEEDRKHEFKKTKGKRKVVFNLWFNDFSRNSFYVELAGILFLTSITCLISLLSLPLRIKSNSTNQKNRK